MSKTFGVTLIESLVVCGILVLLAAFVFGVFRNGIKQGYGARATSDGRQLFVALSLYQEQSGDSRFYPSVDMLVDSGTLSDASIAKLPSDPYSEGYYGAALSCPSLPSPYRFKYPVSWNLLYMRSQFSMDPNLYQQLMSELSTLDENHGLFTLRVLGNKSTERLTDRCEEIPYRIVGPSIMVRKDGSIRRLDIYPDVKAQGSGTVTALCRNKIFTGINGSCVK